eukprot:6173652-Pleurochrysis_carterae.AAC.11
MLSDLIIPRSLLVQAGQEGAEALAALLLDASGRADITGLATLDFGNNGIGDPGAKAIAAALAQPGGRTDDLKAFSLARNEITAEGANVRDTMLWL